MKALRSIMIHDQIYDSLRRAIMCGHFKPGAQLSARGLAKEFGVSQMPVRDALNRLTSDRALERTQDRRYRVPVLDNNYLKALYAARVINEGAAAELATDLITDKEIETLEDIQEEIEKEAEIALHVKDKEEIDIRNDVVLHNKFHFTLYSACGNPMLISIIESLWLQYAPGIAYFLEIRKLTSTKKDLTQLNKSHNKKHRNIISALRTRDSRKVKAALVKDITPYRLIVEASETQHGITLPERHITEYIE